MSETPSIRTIYEKYLTEERELHARLRSIEEERKVIRARMSEVVALREAAQTLLTAQGEAPPEPAILEPELRKSGITASGVNVHNLGIVEAAIELAREHGVREADAGQVLEWFREVGYESRSGIPTRNSIYVSLNREYQDGRRRGRMRVTRPRRGVFVFHYDRPGGADEDRAEARASLSEAALRQLEAQVAEAQAAERGAKPQGETAPSEAEPQGALASAESE